MNFVLKKGGNTHKATTNCLIIFNINIMNKFEIGSPEFFQACRELANKTYKDKVPQEVLDRILDLTPDVEKVKTGLDAPNSSAKVNVTAAFIYGTVSCEIDSQHKRFDGTHWGIGLAGFAATGIIYTAYNDWQTFFNNATAYHIQSAGVAGGVVQVNWFNGSGIPVGQFDGIAGGAGAMEVGGSGSWKDM